jgi:preprotein translocase subunit SecD
MDAIVVGASLAGGMVTAFVLQRALLEAWLRAMQHKRTD